MLDQAYHHTASGGQARKKPYNAIDIQTQLGTSLIVAYVLHFLVLSPRAGLAMLLGEMAQGCAATHSRAA